MVFVMLSNILDDVYLTTPDKMNNYTSISEYLLGNWIIILSFPLSTFIGTCFEKAGDLIANIRVESVDYSQVSGNAS